MRRGMRGEVQFEIVASQPPHCPLPSLFFYNRYLRDFLLKIRMSVTRTAGTAFILAGTMESWPQKSFYAKEQAIERYITRITFDTSSSLKQ